VRYEAALKSDKFLLLAHGTTDEVARAKNIMHTSTRWSYSARAKSGQSAGGW